MPLERPIVPSPARIARAHAAGIRPPGGWLGAGIACVVGSLVIDATSLVDIGRLLGVGQLQLQPRAVVVGAAQILGALLAITLGAVMVSRLLGGGLGPVDRQARRRLGVGTVRTSAGPLVIATVVGLACVLLGSVSVIGAAARGADATATSLPLLWVGWASRALAIVGGTLCAIGLLEQTWWRSARFSALHQTVQAARREAAEHTRKSAP